MKLNSLYHNIYSLKIRLERVYLINGNYISQKEFNNLVDEMIRKGENITLVARFLGHSKIEETLNTYSHFFKSDLDNLVSTINELNQENQNLFLNIF